VTAPTQLPTVRFSTSWELYEKVIRNIYRYPDDSVNTDKEDFNARRMISDWNGYEDAVLSGVCSITGLEYRKNIIDICIAPKILSVSKPIIIGVDGYDKRFVDEVMYQLVVQLLIDNASIPLVYDVVEDWIEIFNDTLFEDEAYFVPAFALQKAICLDVLDEPDRLQRIVERCDGLFRGDEKVAWEFVNTHDYKEIINTLRRLYSAIEQEYDF
jgi:hypothetical protein